MLISFSTLILGFATDCYGRRIIFQNFNSERRMQSRQRLRIRSECRFERHDKEMCGRRAKGKGSASNAMVAICAVRQEIVHGDNN